MRLLIILLTFPLSLFGQTIEFEKNASIQIDSFTFPTYILKIDNYSASDPAKVFVVLSKSFDSLKRQISILYFSKKQEYNEYYILGY
jgi:Mlc titration factor MtfA (ptsG expression regulator)